MAFQVWLVSLALLFCVQISPADIQSLKSFLRSFELTRLYQLTPLRQSGLGSGASAPSTAFVFKAFQKTFTLNLHRNVPPTLPVKIFGKDGLIRKTMSSSYDVNWYTGDALGDYGSNVEGFVTDDGFSLIVEASNDTYILEPSSKYLDDTDSNYSSIVYRVSEMLSYNGSFANTRGPDNYGNPVPSPIHVPKKDYRMKYNSTRIQTNSRLKKNHLLKQQLACRIELVVDHTFVSRMNHNVKDVITTLYFYAKRADNVFKSTDFDLDGQPDEVRIIPSQVIIYWDDQVPNYPFAGFTTDDAMDYMVAFSRRVQTFCLSVCFCDRVFNDDVIGMSYRASPDNRDSPGGICQAPVRLDDSTIYTANTGFVTGRGHTGPLPLSVTVHSFIHELGHSFGSEHDDPKDDICSPGGTGGNYLMTRHTIDGSKPRHVVFSPCSREAIRHAIEVKGRCLKRTEPSKCGNSIKEEGEECDCGNSFTCSTIDPCCTPRGSTDECRFRRDLGAECSYGDSPCCTLDCKIVKAEGKKMCTRDPSSCYEATCDGLSAECPRGKPMPDGVVCGGTWHTCWRGFCNSSVCLDHGLENCLCPVGNECHVCCRSATSSICRPAENFSLDATHNQSYWKPPGVFCNGNTGTCNNFGQCEIQSKSTKSNIHILYPLFMPIFLSFIFVILPFIYIVVKYTSKYGKKGCC